MSARLAPSSRPLPLLFVALLSLLVSPWPSTAWVINGVLTGSAHLGDELHMVIHCLPPLQRVLVSVCCQIQKSCSPLRPPLLRPAISPAAIAVRLWQPSFSSPPSHLPKKDYALWMELTLPVFVEFPGALRRHLASLASPTPVRSSACRRPTKRGRQPASGHPGASARK